jgi:hypothetical protein
MSKGQPPGSPERPEGRPPPGPAGQPGSNREGSKRFWRRTPFLMAAPPLAFVVIITVVGCVTNSTGNTAASSSASAQTSASGSPSASASGSPSPPAPSPTTAAPAPSTPASPAAPTTTPAQGASCNATVHTYPDSDHDEWYNDVNVSSDHPDTKVIASSGGYSHSWWTNGSGSAVVYLDGPPPGSPITVTVGGATCSVS